MFSKNIIRYVVQYFLIKSAFQIWFTAYFHCLYSKLYSAVFVQINTFEQKPLNIFFKFYIVGSSFILGVKYWILHPGCIFYILILGVTYKIS